MDQAVLETNKFTLMYSLDSTEHLKLYLGFLTLRRLISGVLAAYLAELYTGEPIFPGNNEQEQLELIMEVCGIPSSSLIDKSRKKDHYFDTDYSPFLIDDEELGILRIPESRKLEDAVSC